jgi:hypothetical protein
MAQKSAPGNCADCGNDAYIRLAAGNGSPEMVCAHCFADRVRSGAVKPETSAHAPKRVEQDTRIHR